jgi:hypothetical protein
MTTETRQRAVRSDAHVDQANWSDKGCPDGMFPSCLGCPLERCRFDHADGDRRARQLTARLSRQAEARRLYSQGLSVDAIAAQMSRSKRSVFRALSGKR